MSDPAVPPPEGASFEERRRQRVEARLGSVIAGRYKLLRVLGHGGMGAVYEAEQLALGRRVAIKLMLGDDAFEKTAVARFVREAKAASRIAHPNIVAVLDADHDAQAHTPYIAQELLTGTDLRGHLADRGRLDPREALRLLVPIIDALDAAHRAGIVHRDLKPENIFLVSGEDGRRLPKLIDFGVSKFLDAQSPGVALTRTGALVGTPRYMPPEQARGLREVDPSADVWSLGVVLFEALAGRSPFVADNYNALMVEILTAEIPALSTVAPETPAWLSDLVSQMLQRDRDRRLPDAAAVLRTLRSASEKGAPAWLAELLASCVIRVDARSDEAPERSSNDHVAIAVADTLLSDRPPPDAPAATPDAPAATPADRERARTRVIAASVFAVGALVAGALSLSSPRPTPREAVFVTQPVTVTQPPSAAPPTPPVAPIAAPAQTPVAPVAPAPPRLIAPVRSAPRRAIIAPRAVDAGAATVAPHPRVASPTAPHVVAPVTDPEHMQ